MRATRATAAAAFALLLAGIGLIAAPAPGGGAAAGHLAAGDRAPTGPGPAGARLARPPIRSWPIPFGPRRKREMTAYSERHYGEPTWRLRRPRVIVEHMAEAASAAAVRNTFAADVPDVELRELPNVCAHFVISATGRIYQLVNLRTRCRHAVGLNWTAIGIEHAGFADSDALADRRQMRASLRLTQYLRCRFGIPVSDVIGHAESLTSRFHRERVPSLRGQTHGDWRHASMREYRRRLRRSGPCPAGALNRASGAGAGALDAGAQSR